MKSRTFKKNIFNFTCLEKRNWFRSLFRVQTLLGQRRHLKHASPLASLALLIALTGCDSTLGELFSKEEPSPSDPPKTDPALPEAPTLSKRIPISDSIEFNDLETLTVQAIFQGENLTYRWNLTILGTGAAIRSGEGNEITLSGVHGDLTEGMSYQIDITATDANSQSAKTSWQAAFIRKVTYVSPLGDDSGAGTPSSPFRTIQKAIQFSKDASRSKVFAAGGSYTHFTPLDGISILGGYDPMNAWTRDLVNQETVVTLSSLGLLVLDFKEETEISGLTLRGSNATGSGQTTYGVRVIDSSKLTLQNNQMRAGRAGTGSNGASGISGLMGQPGTNGRSGSNYSSYETRPGGAGGLGASSPCLNWSQGSGGNGGQGGEVLAIAGVFGIPFYEASAGYSGYSAVTVAGSFGRGGYGGYLESHGSSGFSGQSGSDGLSGTPPLTWGFFNVDRMEPTVGSSGTTGSNGTGGGGGGGGGSTIDGIGYSGGGGGGGGSGGCGGKPGLGGQSGGASIALLVVGSSNLVIVDNHIQSGLGGHGGAGGNGGSGGSGGYGGSGGFGYEHAGDGGSGGYGGSGGRGGNGGPGSGGDSIGVLLIDSVVDTAPLQNRNLFQMEAAGAGGSNAGGIRGSNGVRTEIKTLL